MRKYLTFYLILITLPTMAQEFRYLPIGDSYSIGEGVAEKERFPNQLTALMKGKGFDFQLIDNPGRTGWTTKDALEREIPKFYEQQPNFSTLLIGVNDWVQGVSEADFRKNIQLLMDTMLRELPGPHRLIVLTIPDFSATTNGGQYGKGRDITTGIASFNVIIAEEAGKRNLPLIDIFPMTREMKGNTDLMADDGLHPSGREYELWVKAIFPMALKSLRMP